MMESIEFLVSLALCLLYIGVPLAAAGALTYFLGQWYSKKHPGPAEDGGKN